ncbi:MAG: hypothetical protein ABSG58_02375 [Acidimicrobiales bacterium]
MRRLVALFVLALIGASIYGISGLSSGVSVNHQSVSGSSLNAELSAIAHNKTLECYIDSLDPTTYSAGAGGDSLKSSAARAWVNLRVEGLAINQYVTTKWNYHPDPAQLAAAKSSLVGELTQEASANSLSCPGSATTALAEMPAEMRTAEIQSQATSLYLVKKLNDTIPLTAASMETYYKSHQSDYDTLCISIALVLPAKVAAFESAEAQGDSVATLAKDFSQDASASKGGTYGCYAPSSDSYASVRQDASGGTLNEFPTKPAYIDYNDSEYALFVAVTKRTLTPFATAEPAVLSDLRAINAQAADSVKNTLLEEAAIYVDPAFGLWGVSSTEGPEVFAPSAPPSSSVTGADKLSAGAANYQ